MPNAFLKSSESIKEPYRYTECGLDDVYLLNGYHVHDTPYGEGVSVDNADELHKVIAKQLCLSKGVFSPKELKFLRKMMNLTQSELATLLRCDYQTVARWEKGQTSIPGSADIVLRAFYLSQDHKKIDVRKFVKELAELDDDGPNVTTFEQQDNGEWKHAA